MTDARLDALRVEVARRTGPARTRPLLDLGRELTIRYTREGPGRPAARPHLDEAVTVLDEAHGHLEEGEAARTRTAAMLGWLLGVRHTAHDMAPGDRERGIALLDEALGSRFLPSVLAAQSRMGLGQLLLMRPMQRLLAKAGDPRSMLAGGTADDAADAARAVACFEALARDPRAPAETAEGARTGLEVAEMVATFTGGPMVGAGGLDIGRMMAMMQKIGDLQARMARNPLAARLAGGSPLFDLGDLIAAMDPLDRPTATVIEAEPAPVAEPSPVPAAPRVSAAELRRAFLAALPTGSVAPLLEAGAAPLDADVVDRLVARAEALVDAPDATGADRVLHAVALYRRGLAEGDGWGDGAVASADLRAAADGLRGVDPTGLGAGAVADAVRLAERLDEHGSAPSAVAALAERYRGVGDALRSAEVDGLVYPGDSGPLLYDVCSGRLRRVGAADLPGRVVVAGDDPSAGGEAIVSLVRTAAEAAALARRRRRAPTDAAVFVGNPRRDRDQASIDAMLLRRTFYPRSVGLGHTVEDAEGAGTPGEVRARLDASVLHLGCGVTAAGSLELAGRALLSADEIASATAAGDGGLAVLPASPQGAAPLTEAFLAAGFAGAVAFRAVLPDEVASLVYVLLHAELVDRGRDPARAVHGVRRWLRDPGRVLPDYLPSWYHTVAAGSDASDPAVADAVVHHGV